MASISLIKLSKPRVLNDLNNLKKVNLYIFYKYASQNAYTYIVHLFVPCVTDMTQIHITRNASTVVYGGLMFLPLKTRFKRLQYVQWKL